MSEIQVNDVINKMRALQSQISDQPQRIDLPNEDQFSTMFTQAIDKVNELQMNAGTLKTAFEKGEPGVSLVDVMVASQKASLAFQGMIQVRNKLIEAYKEVMNMRV